MFRKVNLNYPNKCMDRIAGAIVDYAYATKKNPRVFVDVSYELEGNVCKVFVASDIAIDENVVSPIVKRIIGDVKLELDTQELIPMKRISCANGGEFKADMVGCEERRCVSILRSFCDSSSIGECTFDNGVATIKTKAIDEDTINKIKDFYKINEECVFDENHDFNMDAFSNRELSSDLGKTSLCTKAIHGRDLSYPSITLALYTFLKCEWDGNRDVITCNEGDTKIGNIPYSTIVNSVRKYIESLGGFEKLAEWGVVIPYGFKD